MKCIVKLAAVVLILATSIPLATAQTPTPRAPVYIKIASKIPILDWSKWAADQADDATRRESKIIARVVERGFREKAQLVTGTTNVDVVAEQTTSFWRGSVKQQLAMPCTATLAIDLDKVLANATFDPATKTVEVYLPPLSIVAVENHNSKYTTAPEYTGGCWDWYDAGTATKMEINLLKSDWGTLARERIDPNAEHLRAVAKNETTRFLEGLLVPINPGLKIVVNP